MHIRKYEIIINKILLFSFFRKRNTDRPKTTCRSVLPRIKTRRYSNIVWPFPTSSCKQHRHPETCLQHEHCWKYFLRLRFACAWGYRVEKGYLCPEHSLDKKIIPRWPEIIELKTWNKKKKEDKKHSIQVVFFLNNSFYIKLPQLVTCVTTWYSISTLGCFECDCLQYWLFSQIGDATRKSTGTKIPRTYCLIGLKVAQRITLGPCSEKDFLEAIIYKFPYLNFREGNLPPKGGNPPLWRP